MSPSKKGAVAETNYEDAIECPTGMSPSIKSQFLTYSFPEAVTKSLVANTNNVALLILLLPILLQEAHPVVPLVSQEFQLYVPELQPYLLSPLFP